MAQEMAFFRGTIVPLPEANINIMCHGFNYGTGCFEGIRGYWNEEHGEMYLLFLAEHFKRLFRSAKILFMEIPYTVEELCRICVELVRQSGYRQNVYLRPTVYKEDSIIGVKLHDLHDAFHIYCAPMGQYVDIGKGLRCGVSSWHRIDDTMIPARAKVIGGYINSALAKTEAIQRGFDEAIFLNVDGHVSEGSAENIFMIRDGVLVTPGLNDNILEGITRSAILTLADKELGIKIHVRPIDRTELYVADELFLCGTGAQIAWVSEVDHRKVGNGTLGPITDQIRKLYFDAVYGNLPRYQHWVTPVYGTGTLRNGASTTDVSAVRA